MDVSPAEAARAHRVDPKALRGALGMFATGVTVITTKGTRGHPVGVTANSFNSVSLDPPLVLFSLDRNAFSWRHFLTAHEFAVNVLSQRQEALSDRFARPTEDKWTDIDYDLWETGCPILRGCLANLECEYEYTHNGGDHVIFVGRVVRMACDASLKPLLFFRGRYTRVGGEDTP